jgi:hypothetical protein
MRSGMSARRFRTLARMPRDKPCRTFALQGVEYNVLHIAACHTLLSKLYGSRCKNIIENALQGRVAADTMVYLRLGARWG